MSLSHVLVYIFKGYTMNLIFFPAVANLRDLNLSTTLA